jgi:hypothetical protein
LIFGFISYLRKEKQKYRKSVPGQARGVLGQLPRRPGWGCWSTELPAHTATCLRTHHPSIQNIEKDTVSKRRPQFFLLLVEVAPAHWHSSNAFLSLCLFYICVTNTEDLPTLAIAGSSVEPISNPSEKVFLISVLVLVLI